MWYYNHQRAQNAGAAPGRSGATLIPSTAPKMLPAPKMYTRMFYDEKIRTEVNQRWALEKKVEATASKSDNEREENPSGGGGEENPSGGDQENPQDGDREENPHRDAEGRTIPLAFKMRVVEEMFADETREVKDLVDARRRAEVRPFSKEEDEEERARRLPDIARYDRGSVLHVFEILSRPFFVFSAVQGATKSCDNFFKSFSNRTGDWHGVMIIGGPDPTSNGDIKLYS